METKKKIINDPVFGFITIPNSFINHLLQHSFIQRLSRITQLGLTSLVYPGAQHTRLNHSLGAMYLMNDAIAVLRAKGHEITNEESNAALAAILMHDIGHGPFSHVLEFTLMDGITHEELSLALMNKLNEELNGKLDMCIAIFQNKYHKKFLYQLVSGQLDVDRLDYLRRDSFFTGVTEGNIGSARIIKMLNVRNDKLVVEAKGIYSIENFLMARRLMYWQVYLHKTAIAAEQMMIKTLRRARYLQDNGVELFAPPQLNYFLKQKVDANFFIRNEDEVLTHFIDLDDNDIWCALKVWSNNEDKILSMLSLGLIQRKLFKTIVRTTPFTKAEIQEYVGRYRLKGFDKEECEYLYSQELISSNMYNEMNDSIDILHRDDTITDISEASDMLNIDLLSKKVEKYHFIYYEL